MGILHRTISYGILTCLMSASLLGGSLTAYAAERNDTAAAALVEGRTADSAPSENSVIVLVESGADAAPEGVLSAITLPVSQTFRINQGDTNTTVHYQLTPIEEVQDAGYAVDTAAAVSGGLVSFQADGAAPDEESFTITGDASVGIALSAMSPGMYVFDLGVTDEDDAANAYRYDHSTYRLRFYVRNSGEAFVTAQNDSGDKVMTLPYQHERWIDRDREQSEDGSSGAAANSTDSGTAIQPGELLEDGSVMTDTVNEISEEGSLVHQLIERGSTGPLTGDMSHMMLYAAVVLLGIAGLVIWRRLRY